MTQVIEKRTMEIEAVVDVTCNRCHKSCRSEIGNIEALRFQESWGYGSHWDGERWSGHLCQECAIEFERFVKEKGGKIDKSGGLLAHKEDSGL